MNRLVRIRILFVLALTLTVGAVWVAAETERWAADDSYREAQAVADMRIGMLDQDAAVDAFIRTGRLSFLNSYDSGRRRFESALSRAKSFTESDRSEEAEALDTQERSARAWQKRADRAIAQVRSNRAADTARADRGRDRILNRFNDANNDLRTDEAEERSANLNRSRSYSIVLIALGLMIGGVGYLVIDRGTRADERRRRRQAHFDEIMQLARTEDEAYDVLKRHLETSVANGRAVVLNRNNSANRLEPRTELPEESKLAESLQGAEPDSCLAIRTGRAHERGDYDEPLLTCEVCGHFGGKSTCVPSLVGGEVIGSVLLHHPKRLDRREADQLKASVTEAAPVIANLRNLALAEMRAATDALTGLPNNRAVHETLRRMVAQSGRTVSRLAAVMFDLDHFKRINDTHGHGKGDQVLAAIGDAAGSSVRTSDFVGRYGGEEFVLLLPDTNREGAIELAEKLRETISALKIAGLEQPVTASFGVAVYPDEAGDAEELMRVADRALYRAKAHGRNRVEVAVVDGAVAPFGTAPDQGDSK